MNAASPVVRESTDQEQSRNSKQKLYVVAFASFGLLIATQFRHLFATPVEAASPPANAVPSEQVPETASTPHPNVAAATFDDKAATGDKPTNAGDVLIVERTILQDDAPANAETTQPPTDSSSKTQPATADDACEFATRGDAPRPGDPETTAIVFALLRSTLADESAFAPGDSFSPGDLQRFLAVESAAEQGFSPALHEDHQVGGRALAHLFGFATSEREAVPSSATARFDASDAQVWTAFLVRLKSAAPLDNKVAADTATAQAEDDLPASEPAQSVAATKDDPADETKEPSATDAPAQVPAELSTPADETSSDRR